MFPSFFSLVVVVTAIKLVSNKLSKELAWPFVVSAETSIRKQKIFDTCAAKENGERCRPMKRRTDRLQEISNGV